MMSQKFELIFRAAEESSEKLANLDSQLRRIKMAGVNKIEVNLRVSYGSTTETIVVDMGYKNKELLDLCLKELNKKRDKMSLSLDELKNKLKNEIDEM